MVRATVTMGSGWQHWQARAQCRANDEPGPERDSLSDLRPPHAIRALLHPLRGCDSRGGGRRPAARHGPGRARGPHPSATPGGSLPSGRGRTRRRCPRRERSCARRCRRQRSTWRLPPGTHRRAGTPRAGGSRRAAAGRLLRRTRGTSGGRGTRLGQQCRGVRASGCGRHSGRCTSARTSCLAVARPRRRRATRARGRRERAAELGVRPGCIGCRRSVLARGARSGPGPDASAVPAGNALRTRARIRACRSRTVGADVPWPRLVPAWISLRAGRRWWGGWRRARLDRLRRGATTAWVGWPGNRGFPGAWSGGPPGWRLPVRRP